MSHGAVSGTMEWGRTSAKDDGSVATEVKGVELLKEEEEVRNPSCIPC
jgi:hypothetical protein